MSQQNQSTRTYGNVLREKNKKKKTSKLHNSRSAKTQTPVLSPGFSPSIWGPLAWKLFHDIATAGDLPQMKPHRQKTAKFFRILKYMLPCVWCRDSFATYLKELPPKYPFTEWVFNMHNKVNKKLERMTPITLDQFKRRAIVYTSFGSTEDLWDLCYIFVMNYNPVHKRNAYKNFFRKLGWWVRYLVETKKYDTSILKLGSPPSEKMLEDKYALLCWLTRRRDAGDKLVSLIKRYAYAMSSSDPSEIWNTCGNLVLRAFRDEQKRKSKSRPKSRSKNRKIK